MKGQINALPAGWEFIRKGRRKRPGEWLVEKIIFLVALSAIVLVFLIFAFVANKAWPVIFGKTDSSKASGAQVIPVADMVKYTPQQLQAYLGVSEKQWAQMDDEGRKALMELKVEMGQEKTLNRDAGLNTSSWRYLLMPQQWTGYDKPEYIWQPVSQIHKYNLVPLIIGSLKCTLIALLFAVPLALGAAIYVSQLASVRTKEWLKPGIEMLAGIPSVVLGFFALIVMSSFFQGLLGYESRLNALVSGLALGLAVIPVVFSIAEDALTSVPRSYVHAALALGSSKWQVAWQIVLPAALPGVFAAVVLGFGRAVGETMVVLMASGNASIVSWSLLDSCRTMTATIAAELAETVVDGHHYRILFLIGAGLFAVTFLSNLVADVIISRLKSRLEGNA
jgi:phosphate transport system permease protein